MCPDRQLLSAYYDGELDAGHAERLARHVESCRICMAALEEFRTLSTVLKEAPMPAAEAGTVRTREHIRIRAAALNGPSLWRRTMFVPAPVALALTAAVVVLAATLALSLGTDLFVPSANDEPEALTQGSAMTLSEAVWKYLDEQQSSSQFVVRFPADMDRVVSQPSFVRAAEYRRGEE